MAGEAQRILVVFGKEMNARLGAIMAMEFMTYKVPAGVLLKR